MLQCRPLQGDFPVRPEMVGKDVGRRRRKTLQSAPSVPPLAPPLSSIESPFLHDLISVSRRAYEVDRHGVPCHRYDIVHRDGTLSQERRVGITPALRIDWEFDLPSQMKSQEPPGRGRGAREVSTRQRDGISLEKKLLYCSWGRTDETHN